MDAPQPPYVYDTRAEAEAASNALYLAQNPQGTTELLYGWLINADGKYQLGVPDVSAPSSDATPGANTPAPTLDSVKSDLLSQLSDRQEQAMDAGMPYTFPDGASGVVQTDDAGRANVNGLVTLALVMQAQGNDTPFGFRDEANVAHPLTPAQMIAMGVAVQQFATNTYEVKWAKQAEIEVLTDLQTAQNYDINAGF